MGHSATKKKVLLMELMISCDTFQYNKLQFLSVIFMGDHHPRSFITGNRLKMPIQVD